jgi:hypothetical protein
MEMAHATEITKKQQKLWEKAIRLTLINRQGKLKQRLGKWTKLTHQRHPWYYCPDENVLLNRSVDDDGNVYFERYETRENGQGFETEPTERRRGRDTQWIFYPTEVTQQGHRLTSSHRG